MDINNIDPTSVTDTNLRIVLLFLMESRREDQAERQKLWDALGRTVCKESCKILRDECSVRQNVTTENADKLFATKGELEKSKGEILAAAKMAGEEGIRAYLRDKFLDISWETVKGQNKFVKGVIFLFLADSAGILIGRIFNAYQLLSTINMHPIAKLLGF